MGVIRETWESFFNDVMKPCGVPKDCPQYIEMRKAFYAGAGSTFKLIVEGLIETDSQDEEAGTRLLDGLKEEFDAYKDELKASLNRPRIPEEN
jgi:hypothetical protein